MSRAEREARVVDKLDELERTDPAKHDEIKLLARLFVESEREQTNQPGGSP